MYQSLLEKLDQYYLSGRYPDALPSGAPYEVFTIEQAEEALKLAERFVFRAREEIENNV